MVAGRQMSLGRRIERCWRQSLLISGLIAAALAALGSAQAQTTQPLYVLSQNAATGAGAILTVPTSGAQAFTVTASWPVAGSPNGIAESPDSTAFLVDDSTHGSLSVVSLAGSNPGTVLGTITGVTASSYLIGYTGDYLHIADAVANTVSVVPTRGPLANTVIATIGGFDEPRGLAGETYFSATGPSDLFYVANYSGNSVAMVPTTGFGANTITATIPVGVNPLGMALTDSALYVANSGSNSISIIARTGAQANTVVKTITGLDQPRALFLSSSETTLYALEAGTNQVAVIPLIGGNVYTVASTITVGNGPRGARVSTDGSTAYVINAVDNTISVISLATNTVTQTISGLGIIEGTNLGPIPTSIVGAVLPGSRTVQQASTATVFATLINAGTTQANGCRIALPIAQAAPITLTTERTDPTTNVANGYPDEPVNLPAGASATFLLSFQASAVAPLATQPLNFFCNGIAPATEIPGVNTVDLTFGAPQTADVIALAATSSGDGIVAVPFSSNGAGAFAVASANVGATATLTVTADTGGSSLPITATVCATDATTGQCLATPATSVATSIASGATPTFSVFVTASGSVPLAPGTARVFLRFLDANGVSHGATSVAVETD